MKKKHKCYDTVTSYCTAIIKYKMFYQTSSNTLEKCLFLPTNILLDYVHYVWLV